MPQGRDEAGNLWEYDGLDANGEPINPRPVRAQAPRGTVYTPPPKPKDPPAPNLPTGWQLGPDGVAHPVQGLPSEITNPKGAEGSIPDVTAKIRADALGQFNGARMLKQAQTTLTDAYKKGPGSTRGIYGLADFLPEWVSERNQNFNKDAEAGRGMVVQGLGLTGGSVNSMAEAQMWTGPYTPSASDWDSTTKKGISRLDPLRETAARKSISVLGGVPDLDGTLHPVGSPRANQILGEMGLTPDLKAIPNVWDQVNAQGDGPPPVAFGSTGGNDGITQPIPPEANQELAAYYMQNAGRLNPQEYAAFRLSLAKKYNFEIPPGLDLLQEAAELNDYYAKGGRGTPRLTPQNKEMSELDWLRNSAVNNPVGAGVANFADGVSMGGVSALTGNRMADLSKEHFKSAVAGQVVGGVLGSEGLGYAGRQIAQRVLPKLLGGGRAATFGRQVAQDAAYGGAYGQNTSGDPVNGALLGAVGSAGGQLATKGGGAIIGGLKATPQAQALLNAKIPLTTGATLGGIPKAFEDRMTSIPGIGDLIRRRQLETVRGYNAAEFADAGAAIGANPANIGKAGVRELKDANSAYYRKTLDPVRIDANDPQFIQDVAAARSLADSSIPNVAPTFPRDYSVTSLKNRIGGPIDPNGMMSGRNFQESYRGLARDARTRVNGDYGHEIGDVARQGQDALASVLERQNPGAYSGFRTANTTNRRIGTLEDAVTRARNGTRSGEPDVFMPSQYIDAAAANAKKFPGGLDTSLAKNAQQVIPSGIADSGTASRGAQIAGMAALPTVLGGGGAATDYMGVTDNGARNGLILAALLAGGGTKRGQAIINGGLFNRPAAAKKIGGLLGDYGSRASSALLPLLMQYQRAAEAQQ